MKASARAERRLIYMSVAQLTALKRLSKRAKVSQAALFRRAIDLVIAAEATKRSKQ